MIERVARIFCTAADRDPDKPFVDRHGVTHDYPGWAAYRDHATEAILALRDPVEEQLHAVCDATDPQQAFAAADDWRAMIDAALEDLAA